MHRLGRPYEQIHTTRSFPKRADEIANGGSLYWVIKGKIAARQELLDLRAVVDGAGISRCNLVLQPDVIPVEPRPCRPFQGWRYLEGSDAPRDMRAIGKGAEAMPEEMRRELADLGLL